MRRFESCRPSQRYQIDDRSKCGGARSAAAILGARRADAMTVDKQVAEGGFACGRDVAVAWHDQHATADCMSNSRSNNGAIDVDGETYDWQLQREPQWSDDDGWKGMIVSLRQRDTQREALLEFPPPKRLLKGLQRGRLQLDDATVSRGIRAALAAGWEPVSRGKPMVFTVDAEGR